MTTTKAPLTIDGKWERARLRAFSEGVQVWRVRDSLYVSPSKSEPGAAYEIQPLPDGSLSCSCRAGLDAKPCKHAAAVWMLLQTAPAPAPDVDPARAEREAQMARDLEDQDSLYGPAPAVNPQESLP